MLALLKERLKITWDYEDAALQSIIAEGKAYLNSLTKVELDFDTEGEPRRLLLEYCRYVYNNAGEYFIENFERDVLLLQLLSAIGEQKGDGDEG